MEKITPLAKEISDIIKTSGGRNRLAHMIIQESPGWFDIQTQRFFKKRAYHADRYIKKKIRVNGWSDEDIYYLLDKFGTMPVSKLAKILGRTLKATSKKFYQVASADRIYKIPVLVNGSKYSKK